MWFSFPKRGGSLALAFCYAGGANPWGFSLLLGAPCACVFIWSLGELLPVLPIALCPARGSVVDGLLGFHSLSPPRVNNRWFLAAPVLAQGGFRSSGVSPLSGMVRGLCIQSCFHFFSSLEDFTHHPLELHFPIALPSLTGPLRAAPTHSDFPFTLPEVPVLWQSGFPHTCGQH